MNQRIRNKYQKLYNELAENDDPISNHACKKLIHMFGVKNTQTRLSILHDDDISSGDVFAKHEPGKKYHAEDCNYNNPNNAIYWRKKSRRNKQFRYPR